MIRKVKFLPKDVYDVVLKYAVIPTFDLVIEYGNQGVIFVKRTIPPYKNVWALPGLRMLKSEEINDALERIALWELGLKIDPRKKIFLGQYVGKFKSEQARQDLSTGYYLAISDKQKIKPNKDHFSDTVVMKKPPQPMGAMYKFYLKQYADLKGLKSL